MGDGRKTTFGYSDARMFRMESRDRRQETGDRRPEEGVGTARGILRWGRQTPRAARG